MSHQTKSGPDEHVNCVVYAGAGGSLLQNTSIHTKDDAIAVIARLLREHDNHGSSTSLSARGV